MKCLAGRICRKNHCIHIRCLTFHSIFELFSRHFNTLAFQTCKFFFLIFINFLLSSIQLSSFTINQTKMKINVSEIESLKIFFFSIIILCRKKGKVNDRSDGKSLSFCLPSLLTMCVCVCVSMSILQIQRNFHFHLCVCYGDDEKFIIYP